MDSRIQPDELSLTARRIRSTKTAIAIRALELARNGTWEATTVPEIAAASGVSERSFYRYFQRKSDVFRSLLDDASERMLSAFRSSEERDLALRAATALDAAIDSFPGGREQARFAYGLLHSTPSITGIWLDGTLSAEVEFAAVLDRAYPELDGKHGGRLLAAVILAAERFAVMRWALSDRPDDLFEQAQADISQALAFGGRLEPYRSSAGSPRTGTSSSPSPTPA